MSERGIFFFEMRRECNCPKIARVVCGLFWACKGFWRLSFRKIWPISFDKIVHTCTWTMQLEFRDNQVQSSVFHESTFGRDFRTKAATHTLWHWLQFCPSDLYQQLSHQIISNGLLGLNLVFSVFHAWTHAKFCPWKKVPTAPLQGQRRNQPVLPRSQHLTRQREKLLTLSLTDCSLLTQFKWRWQFGSACECVCALNNQGNKKINSSEKKFWKGMPYVHNISSRIWFLVPVSWIHSTENSDSLSKLSLTHFDRHCYAIAMQFYKFSNFEFVKRRMKSQKQEHPLTPGLILFTCDMTWTQTPSSGSTTILISGKLNIIYFDEIR